MSAAATTEPADPVGSRITREAAAGRLPEWAVVGEERRRHIERVVALLDEWSARLQLPPDDRLRWRAAGWLHDALREAEPEALRTSLPARWRELAAPLLHGPAAAERLRGDADDELLDAIRYHTLGHPSFGPLGRALYLADFLEPGRDFEIDWRAGLRARMPHDEHAVLVEVVAARIRYLVESRKPLRPETAAFWSRLVTEPTP